MARPLCIEFPGGVYHVTSRGNAQAAIFLDDVDRNTFLAVLRQTLRRFNVFCHAYCLMTNHFHLLLETPDANLSKAMRQLNKAGQRHRQSVSRIRLYPGPSGPCDQLALFGREQDCSAGGFKM